MGKNKSGKIMLYESETLEEALDVLEELAQTDIRNNAFPRMIYRGHPKAEKYKLETSYDRLCVNGAAQFHLKGSNASHRLKKYLNLFFSYLIRTGIKPSIEKNGLILEVRA